MSGPPHLAHCSVGLNVSQFEEPWAIAGAPRRLEIGLPSYQDGEAKRFISMTKRASAAYDKPITWIRGWTTLPPGCRKAAVEECQKPLLQQHTRRAGARGLSLHR